MRNRRALIAIAALVTLIAGGWWLSNTVLAPLFRGGSQPLGGTVLPSLSRSDRLAPLPGSQTLTVVVVLTPQSGLKSLSAVASGVSDPASPSYGQYLTSAQVRTRFAPSPTTVQTLTNYLRTHGLTIVSTDLLARTVTVSGPVSGLETAFGVHLFQWRDRTTHRVYFAHQSSIALPAALATQVVAVLGLDNYAQPIPLLAFSNGSNLPDHYPDEFRKAYDVQPLIDSSACRGSCNGSGQTVALYEQGGFKHANIDTFDTERNLPPADIKVVSVRPNPVGYSGQELEPGNDVNEMEAELDIEMVHAIAPGASIRVYELPNDINTTNDSALAYEAFLQLVEFFNDPIVSISFGECESDFAHSQLDAIDARFSILTSQAKSVFVASDDSGKRCPVPLGGILSGRAIFPPDPGVSYPASGHWVTAVGGTHLDLNSDSSYNEQAWDTGLGSSGNGCNGAPCASGGGASNHVAKLPEQKTLPVGLPYPYRLVPDVAAVADRIRIYAHDSWGSVVGTSASAPLWAAIAAIFNQVAATNYRQFPLGDANPLLYWEVSHELAFKPLIDITHSQSPPSDLFQPAGPGWDFATGLGTPDAYKLIQDMNPTMQIVPAIGPNGTTVHLTASPFHSGDSVSFYLFPPKPSNGILLCTEKAGAKATAGPQVAECTATITTTAADGTHLQILVVDPNLPRQARAVFTVEPKRAYAVTGSGVRPINLSTNLLEPPIPIGAPSAIAITPDGKTAYVTSGHNAAPDHSTPAVSGAVTPIDLVTNTAGTPIPMGNWPFAVAINSDGSKAYVTTSTFQDLGNVGSATLQGVNLNTQTALTPIRLGDGIIPTAIAITPDGKTAYITAGGYGAWVIPVDLVNNRAGTRIFVGGIPGAIAIAPDGKTAYVTTHTQTDIGTTVVPINLASNTPQPPIPIGVAGSGIAITPDGKTAYVVGEPTTLTGNQSPPPAGGTVVSINLASHALGTLIPLPAETYARAIAIASDGKTAYVTTYDQRSPASGAVTSIDLASNTLGPPIPVGEQQILGIALSP